MSLNCIWEWGFSCDDSASGEYSFFDITPSHTVTKTGHTCSGPICELNKTILSFTKFENT